MTDIHLAPEIIFNIGPIPITNSELATIVASGFLAVLIFFVNRNLKLIPGKLQVALEMVTEYLLSQLESAFGSKKKARQFFPLMMTLLLFITIANQLSVVPLIFQVVVEKTPLLRVPTSDLTQTFTLSIIILAIAHILALAASPLKHIGSFIRLDVFWKIRSVKEIPGALLDFFLGLLDIVGELSKLLSLSFRLFGNIFAGEVMVVVIAGISAFTQVFVPIPFMALSIFSGFIQAFVFTLLSTQFIASSISGQKTEQEEETATGKETVGRAMEGKARLEPS